MLNTKKFSTRLSAILVSMVILLVAVFSLSSSQKVEAGDFTLRYNAHDARTGAYLRTYSLTVEGNNSRAIVNGDDREVDYSKNGVVKIITNYGLCSGFVVDEHTIATAAHCVYNQAITSILLFDKNGNNNMTITNPVEYHFPCKYAENPAERHLYDYALITVKQSLEDYECFNFGMMIESYADSETNVVYSAGFPGIVRGNVVNAYTTHALYKGTGNVNSFNKGNSGNIEYIYFTADMTPGDSGGPIYVTEGVGDKLYHTVVGIQVNTSDYHGMADAMSPHLLKFLKGNTNKNY